ncbi:S-formylglutathione hydrolase [Ferrimonas marina]|uniref:S-formylglutathione hydrolase n=1 Tax=Ferrimonas marina TaxID=299255 RepID=A0A1M5Z5W2_9GAMM|nr:S-formylglutathione hydrolase [Ferrimonas marina]SHI19534.1 S-formylglutathione hydrolase [Ferrimonas marina]
MELISQQEVFDGWLRRYQHHSDATATDMVFAVFLPPQVAAARVPVLYWLSGLTCTDENFCQKAGAFRLAAKLGLAIVCPDTSPRGLDLPDEHESYDLGSGAGFYVNATEQPWADHYRMYEYVVEELPALLEAALPVTADKGIAGHSMGGHGALVAALRNPGLYNSVSAFAPICHPTQCPWGRKAFTAYLGPDESQWEQYDATLLVAKAEEPLPILIDQGSKDDFLAEQLKPELFKQACEQAGHPLTLRMHPGYDHSYYFIATFIDDHLRHHAEALGLKV